jgi:hypothetical protein
MFSSFPARSYPVHSKFAIRAQYRWQTNQKFRQRILAKLCSHSKRPTNVRLTDVYFVPDLGFNLVSVGRLADKGIAAKFQNSCVIFEVFESGFEIGRGIRDNNTELYRLPAPEMHETVLAVPLKNDPILWHQRLAHVNMRDLAQVHKHADGVPELGNTTHVCRSCRLGKAHKLPFTSSSHRTNSPGALVHLDTVGRLPVSFPDHFRYMATFLDDYSRYVVVVALIIKKSDIGVAFASFRRFMSQTTKLRDDMEINIEFEDTDMLPNDKFSEGLHVIRLHLDNAKKYKHIEDSEFRI